MSFHDGRSASASASASASEGEAFVMARGYGSFSASRGPARGGFGHVLHRYRDQYQDGDDDYDEDQDDDQERARLPSGSTTAIDEVENEEIMEEGGGGSVGVSTRGSPASRMRAYRVLHLVPGTGTGTGTESESEVDLEDQRTESPRSEEDPLLEIRARMIGVEVCLRDIAAHTRKGVDLLRGWEDVRTLCFGSLLVLMGLFVMFCVFWVGRGVGTW